MKEPQELQETSQGLEDGLEEDTFSIWTAYDNNGDRYVYYTKPTPSKKAKQWVTGDNNFVLVKQTNLIVEDWMNTLTRVTIELS